MIALLGIAKELKVAAVLARVFPKLPNISIDYAVMEGG